MKIQSKKDETNAENMGVFEMDGEEKGKKLNL